VAKATKATKATRATNKNQNETETVEAGTGYVARSQAVSVKAISEVSCRLWGDALGAKFTCIDDDRFHVNCVTKTEEDDSDDMETGWCMSIRGIGGQVAALGSQELEPDEVRVLWDTGAMVTLRAADWQSLGNLVSKRGLPWRMLRGLALQRLVLRRSRLAWRTMIARTIAPSL